MADTTMGRWAFMCALSLAGLGLACANAEDEDDTPWCDANEDCFNGQTCQNGLCVAASGGSASGGSATGGSATGGSASGGSATGGSASGGSATGVTTGGSATGATTTGGGTSPTGGDTPPPDTCTEGDFTCVADTIQACEQGEIVQHGCDDVCASNGWTSGGCDGMQCGCDGYLDANCILAAQAFCVCIEGIGESCDDATMQQIYLDCFEGNAPEIACFAGYVSNNQVDCVSAVDACL